MGSQRFDAFEQAELLRRRAVRRAARRRGLMRLGGLTAIVTSAIGYGVSTLFGGSTPSKPVAPSAPFQLASAVESGVEPWSLATPVSRPVVLQGPSRDELVVAGGLLPSGASASAVDLVNPITGSVTSIGGLAASVHDAAGAVIHGSGYVFGGGSVAPLSEIQRIDSLRPARPSTDTIVARLPSARADAAAVTIGATTYLIGGYNGSTGDRAVLATTDGVHFKTVARLAVPVRYAAVAALGRSLYVFGGNATRGPRSGLPTRTVLRVDPSSGRVNVIGSLPIMLAGAAAANLGGTIYIAGGETNAGSPPGSVRESRAIYAWDLRSERALFAGNLFVAVSHAGIAVLGHRAWLVGGETAPGVATGDVQMFEPNARFGYAGVRGAGSPYFGDTLLIADRGNDRLLALADTGRVVWQYPSARARAPAGGFYFPDDAFFIRRGTAIISNQEDNDTLVEIGYPSGRVLWSYGHPRRAGSAPGYLDTPDDAYLLRNGWITVADAYNCRVLIIEPESMRIIRQIGTSDVCSHNPPSSIYSPNGDTPLKNGNLLVSEVTGSWVDEFTMHGELVWSVQLPIAYPSDPQQTGADRYLIADYASPGAFVEFDSKGAVLYRYSPVSGPGELNHPSLVELLPSGVLMSNDDFNDRMVAIDPSTGAVVWQYGRTGVAGRGSGLLNTPDGFDLLGPGGSFPTHPTTG